MNGPIAYLDGDFIPLSEARVSVLDQGFTMGVHAMELTRTFGRKLFRLDDHLTRLYRTLHTMRLDPGISRQQMARLSHETVERNAEHFEPREELGLVHFVTPGTTPSFTDVPRAQVNLRGSATSLRSAWTQNLKSAAAFTGLSPITRPSWSIPMRLRWSWTSTATLPNVTARTF